MAERIIPEQKFLVCDRCGTEGHRLEGDFRDLTHAVRVEKAGVDWYGAAAGAFFRFDLCGNCSHDFWDKFLKGEGVDSVKKNK